MLKQRRLQYELQNASTYREKGSNNNIIMWAKLGLY